MRIGLFTDAYFPIISGVSISVDILQRELQKLGHEVYVITNSHKNAEEDQFVVRFKGQSLPMKGMAQYKVSKVTRRKIRSIKELNLDIVHCHTEFTMGRLGRRAARKYNLPVVHTYHTMYEDYCHHITKTFVKPLTFISKIYSKSFANSADKVVFPTIKVQRTFDRYGFNKESHIVPTGIYLDRFRPINFKKDEILRLRESLGISKDDFVLLFLGRLSREKSIDSIIRNFGILHKDNKELKLLLVGGGPDEDYFKKIVKELELESSVIFTGMIPPKEVAVYYHLGDLFVNFSTTETQGLTYYEALASGLPLLVKYDDNLEGVVKQNFNGMSFKEDEEFIKCYYELTMNKIKFSEITSNASKAIEKFSAKQYARSILDIYEKVYKK